MDDERPGILKDISQPGSRLLNGAAIARSEAAGYADRAALGADPMGYNPPYSLPQIVQHLSFGWI